MSTGQIVIRAERGRRGHAIEGELICYFTDPALHLAFSEGNAAFAEWCLEVFQERIDEEGCGAVMWALRDDGMIGDDGIWSP